jgi:hypothetical protein
MESTNYNEIYQELNNKIDPSIDDIILMKEIEEYERTKTNYKIIPIKNKKQKFISINKIIQNIEVKDITTHLNYGEKILYSIHNNINKLFKMNVTQLKGIIYYIVIASKNKLLIDNICKFNNKFSNYLKALNEYVEMINFDEQYEHIYSIIQHNFNLYGICNDIKITDDLFKILTNKKINQFDINKLMELQLTSIELLHTLEQLNKNIHTYLVNDITQYKETKIKIINSFVDKANNTFKTANKFNIPELIMFNKLVKLYHKYDNILFVFHHFKLPVKHINHLFADALIVFNKDNYLHFAIIEFDGIQHYDINDFRFNQYTVKKDIIKNNFCIDSKISLLRIFNTKKMSDTIEKFINDIINAKLDEIPIINIPSNDHYNHISNEYNKLIINYCTDIINIPDNIITLNKKQSKDAKIISETLNSLQINYKYELNTDKISITKTLI